MSFPSNQLPPLRIREVDGSPNVIPVFDIILSNNLQLFKNQPGIVTISAVTGAGAGTSPTYAATGNTYVVTDFASDLTNEFRLVQSGNSITINTAGNLIVINALTGGGTGTPAGPQNAIQFNSAGSVFGGTSGFVYLVSGGGGRVGIGTDIPQVALNVSGGHVLFEGNIVQATPSCRGVVFMWNPYAESLRAGNFLAADLANDQIGSDSFVGGLNNRASGIYTASFGQENSVPGNYSFALGYQNSASGQISFVVGSSCTASGANSFCVGVNNSATGVNSVAFGASVQANADDSMVFGVGVNNTTGLFNPYVGSLMMGFRSKFPTLFMTTGAANDSAGRVAIGNTSPLVQFHVAQTGMFGHVITTGSTSQGIFINRTAGNPIFALAPSNDGLVLVSQSGAANSFVWLATGGGGSSVVYAATGNRYVVTDFETDLTNEFRLVQSGNSITISTASNLIIINAVTNGGGGTQTIQLPMALLSVKVNSANAYYTVKSGTNLDAAHIQFVDSGTGIASYWCQIPNNVQATENWNLFFDHEAEAGSGGNVVLSFRAATAMNLSVVDQAPTVLISSAVYFVNTFNQLTNSSASTAVMDSTLGLAAKNYFRVVVERSGGHASDTVNAHWNLKGLYLQLDVAT